MHDGIDATRLRLQSARDVAEIVRRRGSQVQRQDDRLWMTGLDNLIVERLELSHHATMQHHRGPMRSAGTRKNTPEASSGSGDDHYARGERWCNDIGRSG